MNNNRGFNFFIPIRHSGRHNIVVIISLHFLRNIPYKKFRDSISIR